MSFNGSISPLVRIQPFSGLVIDPDTWATAHEYHRAAHRLHLLAMHPMGIHRGLDVTLEKAGSILIAPGVALDSAGRVIVVPEPQRVKLQPRGGPAFVTLDFAERSDETGGNGRLVEDFLIRVTSEEPVDASIELCRVQLSSGRGLQLEEPEDPWHPKEDEIDRRHRPQLPAAPRRLRISMFEIGEGNRVAPDRVRGLFALLNEARALGADISVHEGEPDDPSERELVIALADGTAMPTKQQLASFGAHGASGAWILVDSASSADGQKVVSQIEEQIDSTEARADAARAEVLTARATGAPPSWSQEGGVRWAHRAVLSSCDLALAWAGHSESASVGDQRNRDAIEFALNVLIAASR